MSAVTHSLVLLSFIFFQFGYTLAAPQSAQLLKREWTVGQAVKTSSGTVLGHNANNKTQVSEYLGIPFAKPPIGSLRWAAPVKYTGAGTINASTYVGLHANGYDNH
jgi:hypothetical protein